LKEHGKQLVLPVSDIALREEAERELRSNGFGRSSSNCSGVIGIRGAPVSTMVRFCSAVVTGA